MFGNELEQVKYFYKSNFNDYGNKIRWTIDHTIYQFTDTDNKKKINDYYQIFNY